MNPVDSPKQRLLVVSLTFPYPLISGGKQRVFHVLRELSGSFAVTLLTLGEKDDDNPTARAALAFLQELIVVPIRQNRLRQMLRLAGSSPRWLLGTPAEVLVKRSSELMRTYDRLVNEQNFSSIQIEFSQLIPLFARPGAVSPPTVFVAHDISFISQQRKADTSRGIARWFWRRESALMRRLEVDGWKRATRVQAMSCVDRGHILALAPSATVDIVPNGVDTQALNPLPDAQQPSIVFVGWMRHFPNRDAIAWFIHEIWPTIRRRNPDVRLTVVGGGLPRDLLSVVKRDDRVDYLGFVDDVKAVVGSAWVSVVPIRIGSGSRLKILESMALGTPVVTTTIGCEGIAVKVDQQVLIADHPGEFADRVLNLLEDPTRRRSLAAAARRLVEANYAWDMIGLTATASVAATMAADQIRPIKI